MYAPPIPGAPDDSTPTIVVSGLRPLIAADDQAGDEAQHRDRKPGHAPPL